MAEYPPASWLIPIVFIALLPASVTVYVFDHNARVRDYETAISACERDNAILVELGRVSNDVTLPKFDCAREFDRPLWFWQG